MVFSSISFLFYFLPCVLVLYFIAPRRIRNAILAISSLVFYAWGEPRYILIMLFSTVVDYTCGRLIARDQKNGKKGKVFLIASIIINLSVLGFFKYYNFLAGSVMSLFGYDGVGIIEGLTLPIGISFYTFQSMSYTIDVYRKNVPAQKNIINFATFVTLFPQLIAGPIVKYIDIAEELDDKNRGSIDMFSEGAARFIAGLGKKVLFANNIGLLWDAASGSMSQLSVVYSWIGIIAFAFQIYFDFSGYSDMAIGLGKMFGFNFPENFNYPYISQSITEFWRRWHMTLGSWFREYVYIPLGGNRVKIPKHIRNIIIVWLLTGIWHGANWNFFLWGVYYGIILLVEKLFLQRILDKLPRFFRHAYAIFFIILGWVIFAFEDLTSGLEYMRIMFGGAKFIDAKTMFDLVSYLPLLLLLGVASTPICKKLMNINLIKRVAPVAIPILALCTLLLSVAYLVDSGYNPFLYFRF